MASIMTRKTKDGTEMYTARVRIKGYPQQTATFSRKTDAKLWQVKTKASIRDGKYFSQAEAKKHTLANLVNQVCPDCAREQIPQSTGAVCTAVEKVVFDDR